MKKYHQRNTNPIVRAERGAVGADPIAIADKLDRVFFKIMFRLWFLLPNHIEMTLQDKCLFWFIFRTGWDIDDQIPGRVGSGL